MPLIRARLLKGVLGAALCGLGLVACGVQVPNQPAKTSAELCQNDFQICVMPILSGQILARTGGTPVSCANAQCHAPLGSGGRFTLGSNVDDNFNAVKSFVNFTNPDDSLILVEPTQDDVAPSASAGPHGGGEIFPSRSDPCYVVIRTWIANQVTDQTSPACGLCTQVADTLASCGYHP